MLTSYDALTAGVFEQAGVPRCWSVTPVRRWCSAIRTHAGDDGEMVSMVQAVVRGTSTALVVADLPFGSYQAGPEAALANAVRHLKEGGAQAVKLEGGRRVLPQVEALTGAGIPVMGHLGPDPAERQRARRGAPGTGSGDAGEELLADARALERAGAFALVLESVPAELARRVSAALRIPTWASAPGRDCDAQIMVWQDMAGLTPAGCRGSSSGTPIPARSCWMRPSVRHRGRRPPLPRPGAQLHMSAGKGDARRRPEKEVLAGRLRGLRFALTGRPLKRRARSVRRGRAVRGAGEQAASVPFASSVVDGSGGVECRVLCLVRSGRATGDLFAVSKLCLGLDGELTGAAASELINSLDH